MNTRALRRFIGDLLRRDRPRPFPAEPRDEAELRMAIMLSAARPGSGVPSEEFIERLHGKLAEELNEQEPPTRSPGGSATRTRRRFVQGASIAAASAALGAGVDHLVAGDSVAAIIQDTDTITPNAGEWRAVVASAELTDGGVRPFDVGTVMGFVGRNSGKLVAVSGVCTHLGCRLALDLPNKHLNCPCHQTVFATTGEVVRHQLPIQLPPLPKIPVRELNGMVEIYAPIATI
jgi:nitrite reductase/ring-hydroxylating ferredoxin subunit